MAEPKNIDTKSNMFYFFIFTLVFTIIKQMLKGRGEMVWLIIYVLLVFFTQYYINLRLSKELCGQEQHHDVFFNTFLPWLLIFCMILVLLNVFPGWVRPFSNTLGYSAAKFAGIDKLARDIFKKPEDYSNSTNTDGQIIESLQNIYNNPAQMINDIDISDVTDDGKWQYWENMKNAKLLAKEDANSEAKLKGMIRLKDNVGKFFWYLLTGILTIIVSENFILGSTCTKSLEKIESEYDEYLDKQNNK